MKKIILNLVVVFATSPFLMNPKSDPTIEECTEDSWTYGREAGKGDATLEYEYSNEYYYLHCNLDGSYKDQPVFLEEQ